MTAWQRAALYAVIALLVAVMAIALGARRTGAEPPPLDCHAGVCLPPEGPSACVQTAEHGIVCVNVPEPAAAAPTYTG